MKPSTKQFLQGTLELILSFGTIGIALKFVAFFNHWVYFPAFPNILDSAFVIIAVSYFFLASQKKRNNIESTKNLNPC